MPRPKTARYRTVAPYPVHINGLRDAEGLPLPLLVDGDEITLPAGIDDLPACLQPVSDPPHPDKAEEPTE